MGVTSGTFGFRLALVFILLVSVLGCTSGTGGDCTCVSGVCTCNAGYAQSGSGSTLSCSACGLTLYSSSAGSTSCTTCPQGLIKLIIWL